MLGYLSKSGSFASAMVVYSHSVPSPTRALKRIMYERPCPKKDVGIINPWRKHINESLTSSRMFLNPRATIALAGPSQYRLAHTDIQIPDFDKYRRKSNIDPHKPAADTQIQRKMFTYVVGIAGIIPMVYGTKHFIRMFVGMLSPSAKVMAMAKVEIDIGDIPEGKNMTFVWRGKPLFVRHRPAEEIEREQQVDISQLRDKQTDQERAQKPEFLIVVGVCTHLGCVPIANAGEYGGYYCPCHGSHYDASGRIRKGPAPLNLEVPAYEYIDDTKVVVG